MGEHGWAGRRGHCSRRSRSSSRRALAAPLVFDSPHSGSRYPERVPRRLAAGPADAAPLRGRVRRRTVPALRRARRAAAAGALPARLSRRQPRAVRTRPADVRRAAARIRQHPLAARRGRARAPFRASSATPSRSTAARDSGRRRAGAHRGAASALSRSGWRGLVERARARFGAGDPDRLPFDALDARPRRGPLDIVLGDRFGASAAPWIVEALELALRRARLSRPPQQALRRRLHHRALRRAGRSAATPCRSRSTAPFTWTSARMVKLERADGAGRSADRGGRGADGARVAESGGGRLGGGVRRAIGAGRHARTA